LAWDYPYRHLIKKRIAEPEIQLPTLSKDILTWCKQARPLVDGKARTILPFWKDIYNDNHNNKIIVAGRQVFKSTYCTDVLAQEATTKDNTQILYCTYDEINLAGFSRQRLQYGTFEQNAVLKEFPRNYLGNVGEISLKNHSTIYLTTDHGAYHHVEGKSAEHIMLDEAQYQEMESFDKVTLTMSMTQGKITVLGVGGESGSAYEELWLRSNQAEWEFDDPYWREKLQFGWFTDPTLKIKKYGFIVGDYLQDVCKGRWRIPDHAKSNTHWHGYHIPQTMMPQIPLTIKDALEKYNTDPMYSLEFRRKHMAPFLYSSHIMGEFYHAERRPITREMIQKCMQPYPYLKQLEPLEIASIKDAYGDKVKIAMGVDFGSGRTSKTVIAILIFWDMQRTSKVEKQKTRVQVAMLQPRPQEHQLDQAQYITELFYEAKCDIGVGDLGYGAIQVKVIQDGGADRISGALFSGVGSNMFYGCRTVSDETKPLLEFQKKVDEHGEIRESIKIDKTTSIQEYVDFMGEQIPHPTRPYEQHLIRPRLMIPNHPDEIDQLSFIFPDWTSLTRKDLPETLDEAKEDKRQKARKEFNHPSDSLMAMIYALKGGDHGRQAWNWVRV